MDSLKTKGQMYDQINLEQILRSGFDLSHSVRGTGKIGRLIPIRNMDTLPGDSIKGSTQIALQFEPLAVPILANMRVRSKHWYCPFNILWDKWDQFITKGQDLSDDSSVPSFDLIYLYSYIGNLFAPNFLYSVDVKRGRISYANPDTNSTQKECVYYGYFIRKDDVLSAISDKLDEIRSSSYYQKIVDLQIDDLFDYVFELYKQFSDYVSI